MKRITTLLREAEAMTVRHAVCLAGGKSVVIASVTKHSGLTDCWQWRSECCVEEKYVRLEVISEDRFHASIVSAIKTTSHSGKMILVFNHAAPLHSDKNPH